MASSYKSFTVYFTFTNGKLIHIIAVALNLERLYNKTSDLGIDYYYYKQVLEPYSSFFPAVSGKLKVVQLKSQQ